MIPDSRAGYSPVRYGPTGSVTIHSMDAELSGKVVLITGASGGIGRACAELFSDEDAKLAVHGHANADRAELLAQSLPAETLAVQGDVGDEDDVAKFFARMLDHFGRLDAIVVNAGIWPPEDVPLHRMDVQQWRRTIDTNLTGAFLCAREYMRYLDKARPETASIVFVGSSAAMFGEAGHGDYAASKAGMVYGLTRTLKNEIVSLAPRGRVNAVCPAWTRSPMVEEAMRDQALVRRVMQTRALRAIAEPEDIANAVVFLSSHALAGHITGAILPVTGGMEGRVVHDGDDAGLL